MTASRADRTVALGFGLLLALIFTCWAAFAIAGWTVGSVTHTMHKTLPGPVKQLQINVGRADVTVVPGGSRVTIDSRVRGSFRAPHPSIAVSGDTVRISGGCANLSWGHCESTFEIHVPATTALSLDASSGDTTVSGLSAPVVVRASSGDVSVDHLTGGVDVRSTSGDVDGDALAGTVSIESASGDVSAADLRAGALRVAAASGDVDADFQTVPTDIDVEDASGDISLGVPRGTYDVDAEAVNGDRDVSVTTDPRAPNVVRAHTQSGDVSVGYVSRNP